MPAMVAGEAMDEPVLDHPRGAVRALDAMAAGTAQRQRREAAAVEEEKALFALVEPVGERVDERRREPAAAVGRVLPHVDRGESRQRRAAVAGGKDDMAIASRFDHREAFERGGGARKNDGQSLEMPPHHRYVARMIMDAVLLLEARLMCFVDDDQAEIGIREEERRAGTDDDLRFPRGDAVPGAAAFDLAQPRMPRHRLATETRGEPRQHRFGQRDFGEQDERLLARLDRCGDRLHIDFGLSRSGHAVEQQRFEFRGGNSFAKLRRRSRLLVGEVGRREGGIGLWIGLVGRDAHRFERAGLDEAADHRLADLGHRGELADDALAVADLFERDGAPRSHPRGTFAGGAIFGDRAARVGEGGARQHHAQHRSGGTEIIVARPFDELAQRRGDRRHRHDLEQIAQAIVADGLGGAEACVLPHDAAHPPRPQRRDDDAAERRFGAVRHAIIERTESGGQKEDAGAGHGAEQDIGRPAK